MIDTHHLGGFIQNTIKPLIEEVDSILNKCKNLKLKKKEIEYLIFKSIELEIEKAKYQAVMWITLGVLGCLTTYFILR